MPRPGIFLVLGIIGVALTLAAFVYTWLLAIPLGLIGFVHLAVQEHRGYGTRRTL